MDKKHIDENENIDKYGEFVCSYFAWLPSEVQKEKGEKLSKITNVENIKKEKMH